MEYCLASNADKEAIIKFINRVFTDTNGSEIDFRTFMKKVYGDERKLSRHHLIKEDGEIAAVLGIYEQEYCIGENKLSTGFIGSVSVADDKRGKGYMKLLLEKAEEDMRNRKISLAMLSGDRNRYGYFGYEVGGIRYKFTFERKNITRTIGWNIDSSIDLIHIENEEMLNEEIYKSYTKNKVYCCSKDEFFDRSLSGGVDLYEIRHDNHYLGYAILSDNFECIYEIELDDWSLLPEIIKSLFVFNKKEQINAFSFDWECEKLRVMHKLCERYLIEPACSFLILDYAKTLKALLELKLLHKNNVAEDVFTIGVKNRGCYRIQILNKEVKVTEQKYIADDNLKNADVIVDDRGFVNAFMSPASALYESMAEREYPAGWFPLSFAPAFADEF